MCQTSTKKTLDDLDIITNPDTNGREWKDIVAWCAKTEGWTFCESDYETWLHGFPQFWYYMAIDKESKEAVGSLTLARAKSIDGDEKKDLYSVGMYYVRPDFRGSGLGSKLFDMLMKQAGDHNICLNGVIKMSPLYASKYGFDKFYGEKHVFYSLKTEDFVSPKPSEKYTTKDIKDVDQSQLDAYDQTIAPGYDRKKYINKWLNGPGAHTRVAFDKSGKIVGVGCIREAFDNKLSAGPVYAENLDVARTLYHYTMADIPNYRNFSALGSLAPPTCTEADGLYAEMNGGVPCNTAFCSLQFTREVVPAAHEKAFAMSECASSYI